jgi:hypothetical protein
MALPGRSKNKYNKFPAFAAILFALSAILFSVSSCGPEAGQPKEKTPPVPEVKKTPAPDFNADSAYSFVKTQVDLGPRVPGTPAHAKCAEYLSAKLKSYGFEVIIPSGITVQTYDQKQFVLKNIIASYKPELPSRVLICSHWDTRPVCESDTKDKDKPGDGANDGASGVAVAMEIARLVSKAGPNVGVDIIYFDVEDYGENGSEDSWCLGSKYWAKNLHKKGYFANYGILLDMVGGPGAIFPKEGISMEYAAGIVDKVWDKANSKGYDNFFIPQTKQFIGADDHVPVNVDANIPCIDIIQYDQERNSFPAYHHTHSDNMDMIDKKTLKAVGQTLLEVIYNE